MSSRIAFVILHHRDTEKYINEALPGSRLCRKVRNAEAQRLVGGVDAGISVMRRPAGNILKQTDCSNRAITAKVEPMECSLRDADQIACLHFDRDDIAVFRRYVKNTVAFHNKSHFVFVVPMLAVELGKHFVETRSIRRYIYQISRHVSASCL